jgi:hypothetical protein
MPKIKGVKSSVRGADRQTINLGPGSNLLALWRCMENPFSVSIDRIELTTSTVQLLKNSPLTRGIRTVGPLLKLTIGQLIAEGGFGVGRVKDLCDGILSLGDSIKAAEKAELRQTVLAVSKSMLRKLPQPAPTVPVSVPSVTMTSSAKPDWYAVMRSGVEAPLAIFPTEVAARNHLNSMASALDANGGVGHNLLLTVLPVPSPMPSIHERRISMANSLWANLRDAMTGFPLLHTGRTSYSKG